MMRTQTTIKYNHLGDISRSLSGLLDTIVRKATLDIEGGMTAIVAVDTGFLKNSIESVMVEQEHGRVTVGADYGGYVNYGTSRMEAQPFVEPVVADVGPDFQAACLAALKRLGR